MREAFGLMSFIAKAREHSRDLFAASERVPVRKHVSAAAIHSRQAKKFIDESLPPVTGEDKAEAMGKLRPLNARAGRLTLSVFY
jgi:hypothetical protein